MPLSPESVLTVTMDAPLTTLGTEPGCGIHVTPRCLAQVYSNVFSTVDGRGVLLTPVSRTSAWRTTTTVGTVYERKQIGLGDWSGTGWDEGERYCTGDWWQMCVTPGSALTSHGTRWTGGSSGLLRANPWIDIEAYLYGGLGGSQEVLRVDFGGFYRLRLLGDGTGILSEISSGNQLAQGTLIESGSASHGHVRIAIAPCFRRCIYLWGTAGTEVVYERLDLDPSTTDYTATDAVSPLVESATLVVTPQVRAMVQVSECAFAAGYIQGTVALPYAPTETLHWDNPEGTDLQWKDEPDGSDVALSATETGTSTPWTPDGSRDSMDVRADLTPSADARSTPSLYAVGLRFEATTSDRVDGSASLMSYVLPETKLEVGKERTTLYLALKDAVAWRGKLNRLVVLEVDGEEEFRGYTTGCDWDESDPRDICRFTVEDEWKRLDSLALQNVHMLDGMKATEAVKSVLRWCGLPSDGTGWDIEDGDFRLPVKNVPQRAPKEPGTVATASGASKNFRVDGNALIQPGTGEPGGKALRYIGDTYSNRRLMHFRPVGGKVVFQWRTKDTISATSVATFYPTQAAAAADSKDWTYFERKGRVVITEPEATRIRILGELPGNVPFAADAVDVPAEDPTLAEVNRPTNWVGESRMYELVDPNLNTKEMVRTVCAWLYEEMRVARKRLTFEAEWHPEVHRGDLITIDGEGDYLVESYTVSEEREADWGGKWRPCTYVVEARLEP